MDYRSQEKVNNMFDNIIQRVPSVLRLGTDSLRSYDFTFDAHQEARP